MAVLIVLAALTPTHHAGATGPPPPEPDLPSEVSREPGITEVQRAAARVARGALWRVEEGLARVRWSAALPRLSLDLSRHADTDHTGTEYADGVRQKLSTDTRFRWRIDATWDLSRLAWHPDELAAARLREQVHRRTSSAVELATRRFYERQSLRHALALGLLPDPRARRKARFRVRELTALLDALTGGLFSARVVSDGPGFGE